MILEGGSELPAVLLPVVTRSIDEMAPGQVLQIVSQEPASLASIREWCAAAGHELLDTLTEGSVFQYFARKAVPKQEPP